MIDELWAIALLNYPEKGRSIFFNRRWTQINADVRSAIAMIDELWAIAFLSCPTMEGDREFIFNKGRSPF
jgi:hypothetical protein